MNPKRDSIPLVCLVENNRKSVLLSFEREKTKQCNATCFFSGPQVWPPRAAVVMIVLRLISKNLLVLVEPKRFQAGTESTFTVWRYK